MTGTMKCVVKTAPGPGNLAYLERPIPQIDSREILVRVKAAAICGTDVHIKHWNEWAERRMSPPVVIGHEFSGEVVEIGSEVRNIHVGDRVSSESHIPCNTCELCREGYRHVCPNTSIIGVHQDGAFAEYIAIPEEIAFVYNDADLPWEQLALMEPFGVAVHGMMEYPLTAKTVALIGAGPLGAMGILLAKQSGASKVIVLELNMERRSMAKKLGADVVIDPTQDDPVAMVKRLTGGLGVHQAVDFSGSISGLSAAVNYVRPEGKLVCVAIPSKPFTFNLAEFSYRGCIIKGIAGRRMYEDWEYMRGLLAGGLNLAPIVSHTLPLNRFAEGLELMEEGKCCKCVLLPTEG